MSPPVDQSPVPRMPRYEIEIADEQVALPVNRDDVRSAVEALLRLEKVASAEVSIAIVDDPTIHDLNNRYLEHDYPTDVISFALHDPPPRRSTGIPRGEGLRIDGEIIVSTETAIRTAEEFAAACSRVPKSAAERRWSAHDELILYVVHGLLHVVGYDDKTTEERDLMRSREQAVLRDRGLEPRYHEDDGPHGEPSRATHDLPAGRGVFGEDS